MSKFKMLSQVLGLLFNSNDDSKDLINRSSCENVNYKPKKRGRPSIDKSLTEPIPISRTSSNTSLPPFSTTSVISAIGNDHMDVDTDGESYTNNILPTKRRRGRPPKVNPPQATAAATTSSSNTSTVTHTINRTASGESSHNHGLKVSTTSQPSAMKKHHTRPHSVESRHHASQHSADTFDFAYGTKNIGNVRRSRRYRPPDPSKDIIVLHPDTDPVQRFNVNESEQTDFQVCLNDPIDLVEFDDENDNIPKKYFDPMLAIVSDNPVAKTDIDVPEVVELPTDIGKLETPYVRPEIGTYLVGCFYNDYDADEIDESFTKQLNDIYFKSNSSDEISVREFEQYIAMLEREVELSILYNPIVQKSKSLQDECEEFIHEMSSNLNKINAFLNSLSDSGDITAETEQLVNTMKNEEGNTANRSTPLEQTNTQKLIQLVKELSTTEIVDSEINQLLEHSHVLAHLIDSYYQHHPHCIPPSDIHDIPKVILQTISKVFEYYVKSRSMNFNLSQNPIKFCENDTITATATSAADDVAPNLNNTPMEEGMIHESIFDSTTIQNVNPMQSDVVCDLPTNLDVDNYQQLQDDNMSVIGDTIGISGEDLTELQNVLFDNDMLTPLPLLDEQIPSTTSAVDISSTTMIQENQSLVCQPAPTTVMSPIDPTSVKDIIPSAMINPPTQLKLSKCSYLRCYHDFIMDNWSRCNTTVPFSSIDRSAESVATSTLNMSQLQEQESLLMSLRKDLDKARLITDRVRRREKIKRDIIKLSTEYFNATFGNEESDNDGDNMSNISYNEEMGFTLEFVPFSNLAAPTKEVPVSTAYENFVAVEPRGRGRPRIYPLAVPPPTANPTTSSSTTTTTTKSSQPHSKLMQSTSAVANWGLDEDTLLLLGIASCGVGKWTEIRDDFALGYRTSAQMNQRFFRLTKKRIAMLQGESIANGTANENEDGTKNEEGGSSTTVNTSYGNVTTNTSEQISKAFRKKLSPTLVALLELFTDQQDLLWNRISLRYLLDLHQQEKKSSGRPIKHPMQIPIPKEYKQKGFLKHKHLLLKRPSSPNYKLPNIQSFVEPAVSPTSEVSNFDKIMLTRSNSSISVKSTASSNAPEPAPAVTTTTSSSGRASRVRSSPRLSTVVADQTSITDAASDETKKVTLSLDDDDVQSLDEVIVPSNVVEVKEEVRPTPVKPVPTSYNGRGTGKYTGLGKGWRKGLGKKVPPQVQVPQTPVTPTPAGEVSSANTEATTTPSNPAPTPPSTATVTSSASHVGHGTGQYRGLGKGWRKGLGKRTANAAAPASLEIDSKIGSNSEDHGSGVEGTPEESTKRSKRQRTEIGQYE